MEVKDTNSKIVNAENIDNIAGVSARIDKQSRVHVTISGKRMGHIRATKNGYSWRAPFDGITWTTITYLTSKTLFDDIESKVDGNKEVAEEPKPVKETPKYAPRTTPKPKREIHDVDLIPPEFKYFSRKIETGKTDVETFERAMELQDNVLLIGPTGSGKTTLVRYYCAKNKVPYKRISLNGGCTVEDLVGHYILMNGETIWIDGILTSSVRNGWVLAVDEINAAPSEILFVLNSLLDGERILILASKDGEVVKPHPDFRLVATCNPTEQGYAGTNEINEALRDRFHKTLYIDYNDTVENRILKDMDIGTETRSDIMKFSRYVRESYAKSEILTPWSTRSIMNLASMMKDGDTQLIVNRFRETDKTVISDLMDIFILKTKSIDNPENGEKDEDEDEW